MKFRAIKENHLFGKAYTKGERAVTSALAVYVLRDYAAKKLAKIDTRKQFKNRYGFTVSTKVGGAVVRSRCRRIMREGVRALEARGNVKHGYLIVIAARSVTPKLKTQDIIKALNHAFAKLDLFEQ